MSHYVCPKCQHKAYLFGQDGAKDVAKEMHLELLGTDSTGICYMVKVLTKCDSCTKKMLVYSTIKKDLKAWHSAGTALIKLGFYWKELVIVIVTLQWTSIPCRGNRNIPSLLHR